MSVSTSSIVSKSEQLQISSTEDLPPGVHRLENGELSGYKYLINCTVKQSWSDWLMGRHQEYGLCWSKVSVKKDNTISSPSSPNATIVRPFRGHYRSYGCDDERDDFYNLEEQMRYNPSDDLRTNILHFSKIMTPDGQECSSGFSPFRGKKYLPDQMHVDSDDLDENLEEAHTTGIHFFPTQSSMNQYLPDNYSITTTFFNLFQRTHTVQTGQMNGKKTKTW